MDFSNLFISLIDETDSFSSSVEFIDFNDLSLLNDENENNHNKILFNSSLNNRQKKRPIYRQHVKWTKDEDEKLRLLIKEFGEKDWRHLAKKMEGRNSRQCRERWQYYLNPKLKLGNWTQEEDELIIRKREELGPKWMAISKFFENRTDAMIKNRYNALLRIKNKKVYKNNCDYSESILQNYDVNAESPQIENSNQSIITVEPTNSEYLNNINYFANEENLNEDYIFNNNDFYFENDDMNVFVY